MKKLKVLSVFLVFSFVLVLALAAQQQADETVTCAVAGNKMKKSEVKVTHEYKGKTYYFCCGGCKAAFIKDPAKYTKGGPQEPHVHEGDQKAHVHEAQKGQMHSHDQAEETAVDPVCGMKVKKSEAAATFEYKEKTYYFCMEGCKKKFKENPEKYVKKKEETKEIYTCPMHPDVKSDKPGKCPKCGMKLVKKMIQIEHIQK